MRISANFEIKSFENFERHRVRMRENRDGEKEWAKLLKNDNNFCIRFFSVLLLF